MIEKNVGFFSAPGLLEHTQLVFFTNFLFEAISFERETTAVYMLARIFIIPSFSSMPQSDDIDESNSHAHYTV